MKRILAAMAALWALALPAQALDLGNMSDAEKAQFGAAVREYLLENPEVLVEVINALEARQAAAKGATDAEMIAAHAEALFNDGYSHVEGNPEGDVTMVEFMDYRCGYCRKAFPEVKELVESDGNIRLIVKEFPILGEDSLLAARFAMSAQILGGDEAYGPLHDAMMTMRGQVTEASLKALADGLGLDGQAILDGMSNPLIDGRIAANHELAQALQINGTPTFVLGHQMLRGYVPLDGMRKVVAEERRRAAE